MRRIREAVLPLAGNNDDLPKTVREYRQKYKGVSRILDDHPEILEHVHEDLKRLSSGGRIRADTTAVETNIHWPTDASLLWDTWRVAARLNSRARSIA